MAGIEGIAIAGIDGMEALPNQPVIFDDTLEKTPAFASL
jgi:hypothetical protein